MPYLSIETNLDANNIDANTLLSDTSTFIANLLGKPEKYVMVKLQCNSSLIFSGNQKTLAYLELKSIGLPEQETTEYASAICQHISESLNINSDRIYIEFSNAQRHMFGWNGKTFQT